MTSKRGQLDSSSYETLLIRDDARTVRLVLAIQVLGFFWLAVYFDRWAVLIRCLPLISLLFGQQLWSALRLKKLGYEQRGEAAMRRLWQIAGSMAFLVFFVLLQSEFHIWFSQDELPSRFH